MKEYLLDSPKDYKLISQNGVKQYSYPLNSTHNAIWDSNISPEGRLYYALASEICTSEYVHLCEYDYDTNTVSECFKVEEVITNYLSNAIHHTTGEKKITICYVQIEDKLQICVQNTGEPIPEEEMDKIWTKFYKVDKARTREYGGSGIGLSIVKAIMDSMHQKYGVKNTENGVEFWFQLENSCICNENMVR